MGFAAPRGVQRGQDVLSRQTRLRRDDEVRAKSLVHISASPPHTLAQRTPKLAEPLSPPRIHRLTNDIVIRQQRSVLEIPKLLHCGSTASPCRLSCGPDPRS